MRVSHPLHTACPYKTRKEAKPQVGKSSLKHGHEHDCMKYGIQNEFTTL